MRASLHHATLLLVAAGCSSATSGDPEPDAGPAALAALDDDATVAMDGSVVIDVLANDLGVPDGARPRVVAEATHGTVEVTDDGALRYTPTTLYAGADQLRYAVDGVLGSAEAAVTLAVTCDGCAANVPLNLAWDPSTGEVLGYHVFMGPTEDEASMAQVADVSPAIPGFDLAAPTVHFDAWNDLRLDLGDPACFRVRAYNAAAMSIFSEPACLIVGATARVRLRARAIGAAVEATR